MGIHRSSGFIAVAMTVALLGLEAVTLAGVLKVASWWNSPRPATLARAAGTAWWALSESATETVVRRTYPVALAALRATTDLSRSVSALLPATQVGKKHREMSIILATARPGGREHQVVRVIRTEHTCKA